MKKRISLSLFLLIGTLSYRPAQADFTNYIPDSIKKNPIAVGIAAVILPIASWSLYQYCYGYEQHWDWTTIDTTKLSFPKDFAWGTASSALQIEGRQTTDNEKICNSWTAWEEEKININGKQKPRIPKKHRVGNACQHWDRYEQDIELAADLGMNAYRFSIEWSKIEPEDGDFNEQAMQHYIKYAQELIANGLEPIPTLFHHAWPLWLENGFESKESIAKFHRFATYVFNAFNEAGLLNHVTRWLTFNEPAGYALAAYVYGKYPPGKKLELKQCGKVLKNMLDAHVAVYNEFKKINHNIQISLAHMMQPIKPYNPWNPFDKLIASTFDYLLNDVTLIYLQTGTFNWLRLIHETNLEAKGALDFIGINYYTYTLLKNFKEAKRPTDIFADADEGTQGKAIYAEGFYTSLKKVATMMPEMPIFIAENGISTSQDELRSLYYKRHLYVIHKLLQEKLPIIGYLVWTLTDCYGWNSGNNSRYGIYNVNFETQERTLKNGMQFLLDSINKS